MTKRQIMAHIDSLWKHYDSCVDNAIEAMNVLDMEFWFSSAEYWLDEINEWLELA